MLKYGNDYKRDELCYVVVSDPNIQESSCLSNCIVSSTEVFYYR